MAPEGGPDLVSPEEAAESIQCLEQETLLRLFLTGLTGQTGPLSGETSACVRSGFADLDLRAIMLATSGESDEAAAMVGSMAGFLVTLSCLNEEEWQAAGPSLSLGPDDREGLECVMDELGGPEGVAAALQPDDAGPPMAFFSAAAACKPTNCGRTVRVSPPERTRTYREASRRFYPAHLFGRWVIVEPSE